MIGTRARAARWVGTVLLVSVAVAACAPPAAVYYPLKPERVVSPGRHSLTVLKPKDNRPDVEKAGRRPNMTYIVPLVLFWWLGRQGSWVTSAQQTEPLITQLPKSMAAHLEGSGAFVRTQVQAPASSATDFALETDILHLYGMHYDQSHRFGSVFSLGSQSEPPSLQAKAVPFAAHGNVVLRLRLVDTRGGTRVAVWERIVRATAAVIPGKDGGKAAADAVSAAMNRVLAALAHHVAVAVQDGLAEGSVASHQLKLEGQADKGKLAFVIERPSSQRRYSELLTIEYASGQVVDHRIVVNHVTPIGQPNQWMLSRRRPDKTWMPYPEYSALANLLAESYDLRRVDEMYHYHFFGKRAARAPGWE